MELKRGQIYLADLKTPNGSVQSGIRPVVIVQNNLGNTHSTTTIVAPITSAKKPKIRTHAYLGTSGGLSKESIALCEQITTISIYSLRQYIGAIKNNAILEQLDQCIKLSLGIK